MTKFRIRPGSFEGTYKIEVKVLWWWEDAYEHWPVSSIYTSIEAAERDVQQMIRNELWQKAIPIVYYGEKGNRIEKST